jgi:Tfp pilus tip-associated adhesin PilY1
MVNYLRGDDTLEVRNGVGSYRNRTVTLADGITVRSSKLGDIVHSSPVFQRYTHGGVSYEILYAGANDGMLHAFDASNGREQFAYVPRLVFHNLKELTHVGYNHLYYADLTPYVANLQVTVALSGNGDGVDNDGDTVVDEAGEFEPKTFLVGGLGKGGRGYYALDVTDPKNITSEVTLANSVKWEYPGNDIYISDVTNATPIVVTTTAAHGLAQGNFIDIKGVEGNTAANGVWKIADVRQRRSVCDWTMTATAPAMGPIPPVPDGLRPTRIWGTPTAAVSSSIPRSDTW